MMSRGTDSAISPPSLGKEYLLFMGSVLFSLCYFSNVTASKNSGRWKSGFSVRTGFHDRKWG